MSNILRSPCNLGVAFIDPHSGPSEPPCKDSSLTTHCLAPTILGNLEVRLHSPYLPRPQLHGQWPQVLLQVAGVAWMPWTKAAVAYVNLYSFFGAGTPWASFSIFSFSFSQDGAFYSWVLLQRHPFCSPGVSRIGSVFNIRSLTNSCRCLWTCFTYNFKLTLFNLPFTLSILVSFCFTADLPHCREQWTEAIP